MTTFDELFAEHNLTPNERKALVMHLATLRAQKTVEALQDCPLASAPSTPPPAVVEDVALTDEQMEAGMHSFDWGPVPHPFRTSVAFERGVRFAEAHHGIAPKAAQEKT